MGREISLGRIRRVYEIDGRAGIGARGAQGHAGELDRAVHMHGSLLTSVFTTLEPAID